MQSSLLILTIYLANLLLSHSRFFHGASSVENLGNDGSRGVGSAIRPQILGSISQGDKAISSQGSANSAEGCAIKTALQSNSGGCDACDMKDCWQTSIHLNGLRCASCSDRT
ncbi:MAG: hypothetical protein EBS95_11290 [Chitinophagia bacterium]|nr:hypothetical protein [Chitinophagia bacterium]